MRSGKYKMMENVYFMDNNKILCGKITGISICMSLQETNEKYTINAGGIEFEKVHKEELFKTKSSLIKSLIKNG